MLVVGVDTGLRACGLALCEADTRRVVYGGLIKNPEKTDTNATAWLSMGHAVARAVNDHANALTVGLLLVERQYISRGTRNPNQLIGLTVCIGTILAMTRGTQKLSVYPAQWKGGTKKGRANATTWATLTAAERTCVHGWELATTGHNVLDAVGIARWGATHFARLMKHGLGEADEDTDDDGDPAADHPGMARATR